MAGMAAAAVARVATVSAGGSWWDEGGAGGGGENSGRAGSAVTVVVLDAGDAAGDAAGADEREAESCGESNRSADSSSSSSSSVGSSSSGGPGDSGSHRGPGPRLLAMPVTPAEQYARSVGLDGVVLRGWHIRALRRSAGLSVPELAHRLSYSRSQVWSWECERCQCPAAVYPALIAACEVARQEREALLRMARLHLIVIDEEGAEEGDS